MLHYCVTVVHVIVYATCSDESGLCHCLLLDMYLWFPQAVSAAGRNIDCDLSGSTSTQPAQVCTTVSVCLSQCQKLTVF